MEKKKKKGHWIVFSLLSLSHFLWKRKKDMRRKVSLGLRIKMMFVLSWKRKKRKREERERRKWSRRKSSTIFLSFFPSSFVIISSISREKEENREKENREKEGEEFLSLLTPSLFCGSVLTKGGFSWQNSWHKILLLRHSFLLHLIFPFFFFSLSKKFVHPLQMSSALQPSSSSLFFFSLPSSLLILFRSRI